MISQLAVLVTGDDIHPNGCERYIFGWVEHTKFEARAKRASQGAINICFADESARDGSGNLAVNMIAAYIAAALESQGHRLDGIFSDLVVDMKIRKRAAV